MRSPSAIQETPRQQLACDGSARLVGDVMVCALTQDQALGMLHDGINAGAHRKLAFCNAHVVNLAASNGGFRAALASFLVLPDGIGVDIGSRLLYGVSFPANLNGTDFIPRLLVSSAHPLRVGLIGARAGVAERAATALRALDPRHDIIAICDGYFEPDAENEILASLAGHGLDILLVAFGNPRQELWIAQKIGPQHARLAIGVGALFDFLAGEMPRAPEWLRMLRLEWLYRLALEPSRLWRRYVLGNPAFILRMLRQKWAGRK
jgi:exopolysaccharide biosynthesis WecB/TagA/CpsF family protein